MPRQNAGDMTHYKSPKPEDLIPPSLGHHKEWIVACKTGKPTTCNFDYSGALIHNNLLALVAYRVGKKLEWDPKNLKAKTVPKPIRTFIRRTARVGFSTDRVKDEQYLSDTTLVPEISWHRVFISGVGVPYGARE